MKRICSWCRTEGSPADLGEREPLDDPSETHGLCQRHLTQLLGAAHALPLDGLPLAGLRMLIVVKDGDQSLYDYLTRAMHQVEGVRVIVDGRLGDRRRAARPVHGERRQGDRRHSRGAVDSLGCTFVRFDSAQGVARAG
jgi:hypothetical protein